MIDWKVATIDKWIGEATQHQRDHPFRKSVDHGHYVSHGSGVDWSATMALLEKELDKLDATNIVLQMNVHPFALRKDGWIRADAKPETPGIILHFDSKNGHMCFPSDAFTDWQANVRAIARGLEDLRRLDRYGITSHGEQYTGWLQIPATVGGVDPHELVAGWCGWDVGHVRAEPERALRLAKRASHPDSAGGSEDCFKDVVEAGKALSL